MLTGLRIRNFKAWADTGRVELAPLTVLFGSNSSGKSSIHQLLLMLRQTVESPDRRRVLHTGDSTTPVDLGSFREFVFHHDLERNLEFEIEWSLSSDLHLTDAKHGKTYVGNRLRFDASIGVGDKSPRIELKQFTYKLLDHDRMSLGMRRTRGGYELGAANYQLVHAMGRKWPVSAPANFHGFPDDVTARYQNVEFAADLTLELERALTGLSYLGPLRHRAARLYRWSGEVPEHVGWDGERTVDALLAAAGRRYNFKPRQSLVPLPQLVAHELKRLGVIEYFSVLPIGEGRDEYEVEVRVARGADNVLLTDVGFGVSQVLPVVVQCFYAPPGSTIILEQPEIHLHPGVQSNLSDLLIRALDAREDGVRRNVQLVVESHSEHLLRRLLLRIADRTLAPEDVRLYVVFPTRGGSKIELLDVDSYGNIHNWPEDFFGAPMADIARQTELSLERRLAAAK